MPDSPARWSCDPYPVAAAHSLAGELGLHPVTASILVRRGHDTPEAARRFLAASERHDPGLMPGLPAAVEILMRHVGRGSRIVIHGDYDVDGVCSTAVLARALERLGAAPVCELPSRFDDGYGLSAAGVERQAAAGTDLLVTVDCGITAVDEVARARALGIDVVVTDHHRPGEQLPDCTIVHPALGGYPFPELCAAGVAYKLAEALSAAAGADGADVEDDLDLVALATVCDVVPLAGENRRIVRDGLDAIARTRKPGLRALMRVTSCDPGTLDAGGLGFRLGPRINAAGRMRRPDAALELLLTGDDHRAGEIAGELDLLNRERQDTEMRITFAAEAALAECAHEPAYVLAGEDWHPGVIGIVASRLVERHSRPCILIALDGAGAGRGSGRSISAFDLHAALTACSSHLGRYGGHRMAAGFDIAADAVEGFRRDFVHHAAGVLSPHDLRPVERVDALAPGSSLGLDLAEELQKLAPFGHRNPSPTLLVPAARIEHPRPMGQEGQHARFTLASGGSRARAVAFRTSARSLGSCAGEPRDIAVRLERNEWNGTVEARLVLRALCEPRAGAFDVLDDALGLWEHFELQVGRPSATSERTRARETCDRRGEGVAGVLGDLLASGEDVLVACGQPQRWRQGLDSTLAGLAHGRAAIASWDLLALLPALAEPYPHVFALDPPPAGDAVAHVGGLPGSGFAHCGWGPGEEAVARATITARLDVRTTVIRVYRALREAGPAATVALDSLLDPIASRADAALALRVLLELSLVQIEDGTVLLLDAQPTQLERSPGYRAHVAALQEAAARLAPPAEQQRRAA
jgi:single-stranded-DNA-specific exonuclease